MRKNRLWMSLPMGLLILFVMALASFIKPTQPVRFLALGDSYTIGESVAEKERWPMQFAAKLAECGTQTDLVQMIATTGWRTDDLLRAIRGKNLQAQRFDLVALLIGVNNQYQKRPVAQYRTEFAQLLDSAILYAGGKQKQVVVISIPDYAYTPFGQQRSTPGQISQELDEYNKLNKQIALQCGVQYIDITTATREGLKQPELVAEDGLHPSGKLYEQLADKLISTFKFLRKTHLKRQPGTANAQLKLVLVNQNEMELQLPAHAVYEVKVKALASSKIVVNKTLAGPATAPLNMRGQLPGYYIAEVYSNQQLLKQIQFWHNGY